MTQIIPYLSVNNAMEALELYESIFDASDISRTPVSEEQATYFGVPEGTDLSKTTIHGEFKIDGQQLYISDNFTGEILDKHNISVLLECDSLQRGREFFTNAVDNNCKVTEEFDKQFWGDYFGSFIDPFGISWQLNYVPEDK